MAQRVFYLDWSNSLAAPNARVLLKAISEAGLPLPDVKTMNICGDSVHLRWTTPGISVHVHSAYAYPGIYHVSDDKHPTYVVAPREAVAILQARLQGDGPSN